MPTLELLLRTDISPSSGFSEPVVYSSITKSPPVLKRVSIYTCIYIYIYIYIVCELYVVMLHLTTVITKET